MNEYNVHHLCNHTEFVLITKFELTIAQYNIIFNLAILAK